MTTLDRRALLAGGLALGAWAVAGAALPALGGALLAAEGGAPVVPGQIDDIPPELLPLFVGGEGRHGVAWHLLAAVAWRESGWSPDVITCQRHSSAGARGLMQIMPGTAAALGVDPCVPTEAVDGAARYLREQYERFGGWDLALAAYNAGPGAVIRHGGIPPYPETQAYVPAVLERAARYAGAQPRPGPRPGPPGDLPARILALADAGVIVLTDRERTDVVHPRMDGRVLAIMDTLTVAWPFAVSVLKTGHSRCIGGGDWPGCRESHHYHYRAVDIYSFGGELVSRSSSTADRVLDWLASLDGPARPSEVGSPFPPRSPGHFTDAAHQRHIHIGFRPPA